MTSKVLPLVEIIGGRNAVCFKYKAENPELRKAFAMKPSFNADQKAVQQNCGFGGGTHMSVTPCSYCSARGGKLALPSLYKCVDCKARDCGSQVDKSYVCRHTDFMHSEKVTQIQRWLQNEELSGWKGECLPTY
jgi:hypothetical protein